MKILFVTEFFPAGDDLLFSGGVESFSYFLVKELAKKNQVIVLCSDRGEKNKNKVKNLKIIRVGPKASRIDTSILTVPQRIFFLINAIKMGLQEDFDLVQGNNYVTHPIAYVIGRAKKKPTIAWYPDVFVGKWIRLSGLLSGIIGEISERINLNLNWNHFVALSDSTKQKLLKVKIDERKIATIYAGVENHKVVSSKSKTFTIISVSRLVNYKRIDLLIDAFNILKKENINSNLVIVGKGPEEFNLRGKVERLGLNGSISFEKNLQREELLKRINSAHLFCLPSEEEGFGLVVMEAASFGVPYVVTDIPVLKEITNNGQGGLLFKKGDTKNLALNIRKIFQDKKLYNKLSVQAKELSKKYSWEKIANDFETLYEQVLPRPKVVMIVDAWFPHMGGGQIHALKISEGLAARGYDVTILTRNLGSSHIRPKNVKEIKLGKVRKFADFFGRTEFLILALIYCLRNNFDIYHAHAFSPGLLIPWIKLFKKGKTVFTVHGKGVRVAGMNMKMDLLQDYVVYKIPYNLEITVAKATLTKKVAADRFFVIPNGVELEIFKSAIRIRDKIKNILYVGRLSEEKGVDMLIEAVSGIKNVSLTIVGEGPQLDKLKKRAKGLRIKFLGKLEGRELIEQFRKADLFVLPSRTEGQPLTLFEAWAAKLPILVTNVGDNARYVKDGINGFVAGPTADEIKNAIKRAMSKKQLDEIAENGYKQVQNYSWDKIVDKTIRAYNDL